MENRKISTKNTFEGVKLNKLVPQAIDLEQAVLGALMLQKNAILDVSGFLTPDTFYDDRHIEVYRAILELYQNSNPVDILTVTQLLRKKGSLDTLGGAYYISELTNRVNSSANLEYHSRILVELAMKRQIIQMSAEAENFAYDDTTDVFNLLESMQAKMIALIDRTDNGRTVDIRAAIKENLEDLVKAMDIPDGITGVPSGLQAIDAYTGGWQNSDMIIIAARPGMGKTAFIINTVRNAAVDHKIPTAIFSLEMSTQQLTSRLIASEAETVSTNQMRRGRVKDYELNSILHKTGPLADSPIYIDDTAGLTLNQLRAKAFKLKAKYKIRKIVIDYLQLMSIDKGSSKPNREQEISTISRGIKQLAKDLNIPIIALSQLSRDVEKRGGDKRPQLSDLRDSGAIEQDADMVAFLYRPEYYGILEDELGNPTEGVAEFIIAKHRNGGLGTALLKFIGKFSKFMDLNEFHEPEISMPAEMPNLIAGYRSQFVDEDKELKVEPKKGDVAPF